MEKIAYLLLLILAVGWILAVIIGMIVAFPVGLIGLVLLIAFGLLFIKVMKERLSNREDDYYEKHVDQ